MNIQVLDSNPRVSVGQGWGPTNGIVNKFSVYAPSPGRGTRFENQRCWAFRHSHVVLCASLGICTTETPGPDTATSWPWSMIQSSRTPIAKATQRLTLWLPSSPGFWEEELTPKTPLNHSMWPYRTSAHKIQAKTSAAIMLTLGLEKVNKWLLSLLWATTAHTSKNKFDHLHALEESFIATYH